MLYFGMRIILSLITLCIAYSLFIIQSYANQLQINSNSIHLQTQQFTTLPTQTTQSKTIPIVGNTNVLEDKDSAKLSLSISPDTLIFDPLTPTNPLLRNMLITIDGGGASLLAFQMQPLEAGTKKIIPLTSCDNGVCDETHSDIWINNLTFGFGYYCESIDNNSCPKLFGETDDYMDIYQNKSYNTLPLLQQTANQTTKAKLIYKINISASQPAGMYSTTIRYLLIPNL